jgi:sugar phosphate isomerase/epimerase
MINMDKTISRRFWLQSTTASLSAAYLNPKGIASQSSNRTDFQVACMTLPYSQFPLERALQGIQSAGFQYVALGTTHRETKGEKSSPILEPNATESVAKEVGQRCRDHGLEPVMMFSMVYPEHADGLTVLKNRLKQAAAAGIGQVLTFGHTQGGNRKIWIQRFKTLGPIARDYGVLLVVKQHGGDTGTGKACAEIVREVNDPGIKVNYDAGNVMDYLNVDPIPDVQTCAPEIRSFCMKDHRNWPKDEDCAPGMGEIDHYRLLHAVAFTGLKIPLCCENISVPLLPRPQTPEEIDRQARRVREFLELVIAGLQS